MKKVLIISYYWPPCGGIGVLRTLKIAKYLWDCGWEPIIYTAENAHYPSIDEGNFKDIRPETTILRGPIWEPYSLYKKFTRKEKNANVNNVFYTSEQKSGLAHKLSVWIRSNFFIPDARAMWIKPSVKYLLNYLADNPVDAIFSNGPPHSNTRIATQLKKATGLPWLADFQDPWTQVDYYSLLSLTPLARRKHERQEQEVFEYADSITIVSDTWKADLESIGAKHVSVVPWGFDPDDYSNLVADESEKFRLSHFGILGYDRKPTVLFEVVRDLCDEDPRFKQDVELLLVGQVDISVKENIDSLGIESVTTFTGNVDRSKALSYMKGSDILLLLLNKQANAGGRIPGKLFEYLAVKRSILCLGTKDGDSARIVQQTRSGHTLAYSEYDQMKSIVLAHYILYKDGKSTFVNSEIAQYSSKVLTRRVADYLNAITA